GAPPVDATADLVAAGICSFLPTCSLVASTPGFASMIALAETPNFFPIVLKVSPLATGYSLAVAGAALLASATAQVLVNPGAVGSTTAGALVASNTGLLVFGMGWLARSSRWQPCTSSASKPTP